MRKIRFILMLALTVSCANTSTKPIDLVPMYGEIDRSAIPELAQGDKIFIHDATEAFGSRAAASNAFVDQAFRLYQDDDLNGAMRRFNQAWLLDAENPEVYHGLGSILYDQGDNCGAMDIMNKSLNLGWRQREFNRPGFLADLAMITSLCAYTEGFEKYGSKETLIDKSDKLFSEAEIIGPSAYLYDKWWQALYWRADFSSAWKKVFKMRSLGKHPDPASLQLLTEQMPEPKN